ncbi:LysR family transcriptional regulator [Symbiobacterium terraclitae]|uniref:LysR family transcriptional regulator n=1 Tax=Symbiobacterium terraclitae TaxID=557451 RepID=UPI0035B53C9D
MSQLKALVTVVRHNGVVRASKVMHLAQSSVTARIRALEDELGVSLFDRNGRHLTLTAYGETLLPYAERITAIADEAESVIAGMRDQAQCHLALGLASSAPYLFDDLYRELTKALPHLKLHIRTGHTGRLYQMLQDGVVHAAIIRPVEAAPQVSLVPLYEDETILISDPRRAWPAAVQPADLAGERLVVFDPGSAHAAAVDQWLRAHGLSWEPTIYTDDVEVAKQAVANGAGLCFLSELTVSREIARGQLSRVPIRTGLSRPTVLAYRTGRVPVEVLARVQTAFAHVAARCRHPDNQLA